MMPTNGEHGVWKCRLPHLPPRDSRPLSGKVDMKVDGNAAMKFVITDLIPGTWQIKKDGKVYIPAMEVRSDDGILSFEGTAGHYEFLR